MFGGKTRDGRLSDLFAALSWLVLRWPLIVLVVSLVSPISPHVRLTAAEMRTSCAYVGVHGILYEYNRMNCPLIAFIDTRGRGQW